MKKERTVIPQTLNPKLKKKKIKIKIDPQKLLDPIATLDDLDDIDDIDELDKLKTPSRIKSHASSTPQIYSSIKKMRKIDENNFTMMTIKYEAYKQRKPTLYSQWQRDNLKKYIIKTPNNKLQQQPTMDTFKQEGFTDTEKIALMTAVKDCVINSTHAYNATFCRFEGYFTEFILYFGTFNKQTVNDVIVGIQKMHEILSDPYQIISFIDMRHQKTKWRV